MSPTGGSAAVTPQGFPDGSSNGSDRSSLPLVGRQDELAALLGGLDDALAGRGRVFLLVGEAGMGKTRLSEWVADRARERSAVVAWGRSWEAVDTPAFWAWAQAVRQLLAEFEQERVEQASQPGKGFARMVPEAHERLSLPSGEGTRLSDFDSLTGFIRHLSRERPLVLIFEDLHAADESTLLMLQFFGREIRDSKILVVATYDPSQARARGAHSRVLGDIGREGRSLPLTGLDEGAVAELYQAIAGEKPPPAIALAVYKASEGNPLFVDEATRMLTAKGDIHRPDYSVGFRVPNGVRDMIRRRFEALSEEAVTVLGMASVLGRTFDVGLLQRVADLDIDSVLDLLAEATSTELLQESGALGRYRFSHILIRETLYEDLTAAKRMRLHRRIADVLEEQFAGNIEPRLPELAHHWFKAAQAGDPRKTMDYAVRAAEQASARLAFEEAARLYQRALKAADLAAAPTSSRAELERRLCEVQASAATTPLSKEEETTSVHRFAREGEYWTVTYQGTTSRLKDSKGLRYIGHLLRNPGSEIHVLDLVAQVEGTPAPSGGARSGSGLDSVGLGDAGEVLDPAAKAAYKRRLDDLQEELEEAREYNDPERAARLQEEKDALIQQLAGAVGLGGRDRKAASAAERARVSVTKTIKDALRKIADNDEALGAHLSSTVRTGTYCAYTPDPRVPVDWQI
jgi:predicted ATPase